MKRFLMKCGHNNNASTKDGKPACAICNCTEVSEELPANFLDGRKAKCFYGKLCGKVRDSSLDLPFFFYRPNHDFDEFYCGCRGWD